MLCMPDFSCSIEECHNILPCEGTSTSIHDTMQSIPTKPRTNHKKLRCGEQNCLKLKLRRIVITIFPDPEKRHQDKGTSCLYFVTKDTCFTQIDSEWTFICCLKANFYRKFILSPDSMNAIN
jgi:hypothetical protein